MACHIIMLECPVKANKFSSLAQERFETFSLLNHRLTKTVSDVGVAIVILSGGIVILSRVI